MSTNKVTICISKIRGVDIFIPIGAFSFIGTFRAKGTCKNKVPFVLAGTYRHPFLVVANENSTPPVPISD
jgi:hypothetical protein